MSDSQANAASDAQEDTIEAKFAVGWRKLTKEEFLEAVAVALVEKVQDLPSLQSAKSCVGSNTSEDKKRKTLIGPLTGRHLAVMPIGIYDHCKCQIFNM